MSSSAQTQAPGPLPETLPSRGDLVQVRSRRWLVDDVDHDRVTASPSLHLACADDDAQGEELERLLGLRARPADPRRGGLGRPRRQRASTTRGHSRPSSTRCAGTRHRDGPEPVPGAVPGGHQDRRLPDGAAAQGAAAAAREPLHRRRHRPRQDDRGGAHRARAAAAQEGARRSSSRRRRRCSSSGRPSSRSASASCSRSSTARYFARGAARARVRR